MAALVAGVQYGLSSHSNFHENKSLIFVKLTDSAQRAIEDYLRNRSKINQNPTIQFLGNEGQLSFPSTKSNNGSFTFCLSSNQDIEGPQGSFECVQQTGPKKLESLGALPCKMRIQANDDVYETTRHRMHVAEENNKNKCTRVIKTNEPIGRKVKVKSTVRTILSVAHANSSTISKRESPNLPISGSHNSRPSASYKSTSNHGLPCRNQIESQKKVIDIMRRPLKERLIHLLALRPFKRPELYDRINREGIRDKEKHVMAQILKQIAFMRDNTYHLHRCVWNDVQEDWPFYTVQEKAMLKRRKPQNLTPPGSSDGGSSGSGQSPNSTHPGSPPPITSPPPGFLGSKRPGYYQGSDGLPTKRQRISHYKKPELGYSSNTGEGNPNSTGTIPNICDQKQQLEQGQNLRNSCIVSNSNNLILSSDNEGNRLALSNLTKPSNIDDTLLINKTNHNSMNSLTNSNNYYYQKREDHEQHQSVETRKITSNNEEENSNIVEIESNNRIGINSTNQEHLNRSNKDNKNCADGDEEQYILCESSYSSNNSINNKITSHSASNIVEESFLSFATSSCNSISPAPSENFRNSEYPDYITCYTTISSAEQRTRYKAEFNAYYKEYRKLHVQVVKISKQFSQLEEELKEKLGKGNLEGYEATKHQILEEYARNKNVNARFYYLHDKLGHIKKLVTEYDTQLHVDSSNRNNSDQSNNSPGFTADVLHHDLRDTRYVLSQISSERSISYPTNHIR